MACLGKILLINPYWTGVRRQKQLQFKRIWQPLDLAIAAAFLEKEGFSVRILDNNIARLLPREIATVAADFDKIFITSTPYDRWQCPALNIQFFFDTIRYLPAERSYLMGAHVTERPEAILRHTGVRAAILGEPERAVLEIAKRDLSPEIPADIQGIAYFRGGRFLKSPPRSNLDDMDQLPYPAFHLLPMDKYYYELMGENFTIMEGSRGCPYRCSFCYLKMYGSRFRQKGLERLLGEIEYVKERFHVKNIYFLDLEFGLRRDYLLSFCKALIQRGTDIRWCCQTRITDVDNELLELMKKAGCSLIHFGVEAGSQRILKQIGKKMDLSHAMRTVSTAREVGIRTVLFMNLGFTGETRREMKATIALAIRLNPTFAAFHLIVPFPGTAFAEEIGFDPEELPVAQYPHYNFVHHELKTLKSMLRRAYFRFYLRPSCILNLRRDALGSIGNQARLSLRRFLQ